MNTAKKITRGNDFVMRIPVTKIVGGEAFAFPLRACTSITVNLVNAYRRYTLTHNIEDGTYNILLARVEGDQIPCGTFALEVKGVLFGNDWRSNEYAQIQIVENNASADTEFTEDEGESSVEMDTAVIIMGAPTPALNPRGEWSSADSYRRGDTVSHNLCTWWCATGNTDSEPTKDSTDWVLLLDAKSVALDKIELIRNRLIISNTRSTGETIEADTAAALMAINAAKDATTAAENANTKIEAISETADETIAKAKKAIATTEEAIANVEQACNEVNKALAAAQEAVDGLQNISFEIINNRVQVTY